MENPDHSRQKHAKAGNIRHGIMIGLLVMIAFFMAKALGIKNIPSVLADPYIETDLYPRDGSPAQHFSSNSFPSPLEGDRLVFTIPCSRVRGLRGEYVLCFSNYNSIVTVEADGKTLYRHSEDLEKRGLPTGHTVVRVPLPQDLEGDITIRLLQMEDHTFSEMRDVRLVAAQYAWLYPVLSLPDQLNAVFLAVFLFISYALFLIFVILNVRGEQILRGIYLALFCFSMTAWVSGFTSVLFVLTNDTLIAPYVEYVTIFIAPTFFYGYLGVEAAGLKRRITQIMVSLVGAVFIAAALMQVFAPRHNGFMVLMPLCYLELLASAVIFIYFQIREKGSLILKWGIILTFLVAMAELGRVLLIRTGAGAGIAFIRAFRDIVLAPYIVLILEATLIADYIAQWYRLYQQRLEMDKLRAIAYTDSLTGLRNRADFDDHEQSRLTLAGTYTIAFIDVDSLKWVNDRLGHKAGDRLLKTVSRAIEKSCAGTGCKSYRFGGDEFLIVGLEETSVRNTVARMDAEIGSVSDLPEDFPLSVSVGIASSGDVASEAGPEDSFRGKLSGPDYVIRMADRRMYKVKKQRHMSRQS